MEGHELELKYREYDDYYLWTICHRVIYGANRR